MQRADRGALAPRSMKVSILTRPEGRVQLGVPSRGVRRRVHVSILTRPEGRVQPSMVTPTSPSASWFQSSPGQKAGCNLVVRPEVVMGLRVVSILTRPSGRVQLEGCVGTRGVPAVSILTRPEGRVQPLTPSTATLTACFNPHPARRPGATVPFPVVRSPSGFNPHPARRPGATSDPAWSFLAALDVSILTRPEGRVQPNAASARQRSCSRFNPHPARRPGATVGCLL